MVVNLPPDVCVPGEVDVDSAGWRELSDHDDANDALGTGARARPGMLKKAPD